MTLQNKLPIEDINQIHHENEANALRGLAIGKTTAGDYVSLLVGTDGSIIPAI